MPFKISYFTVLNAANKTESLILNSKAGWTLIFVVWRPAVKAVVLHT